MGSKTSADITGLTLKMANGQMATVINYVDSKNMTIQFEDGTIKNGVYKVHFMRGKVANPKFGTPNQCSAQVMRNNNSIVGSTRIMNCGMEATCIADRGSKDIDVQFSDGTIVYNKYRYNFLNGTINNPNIVKGSILGVINTMNCGQKAIVIADKGSTNIDVKFEDGTIVKGRSRNDFRNGEIACPNLPKYYANRKHFVGDKNKMSCGMIAEIICYRAYNDIDVKFEDGTIVEHKTVSNFMSGNIDNPSYYRHNLIGTTLLMNCGQECTVIDQDRSVTNITVQFEDGTIVKNKTKKELFLRSIQNPNIPRFNSLPQALVYFYIKKYFNDAISDFRPDWLTNSKTGYRLELDIWIPSIKIGIEYDGYVDRHTKCTWRGMYKLEAINNATELKELITINERGTYIYESDKIKHYILNYKSHRSEYKKLILDITENTIEILQYLGVDNVLLSPFEIDANFDDFDYSRFLQLLRNKI